VASNITGGQEIHSNNGTLSRLPVPSSGNAFQARYVIRHEWTGPIECENPVRGVWGGPPEGHAPVLTATDRRAQGTAALQSFVAQPVPELGLEGPLERAVAPSESPTANADPAGSATVPPAAPKGGGGCQSCSVGRRSEVRAFGAPWAPYQALMSGALMFLLLGRRRRR